MAFSPDEILRKQIELLVNVGGQPAVDELKRSLDLAQNSLNMFTQSAAAGNVSTADYLRNLNQMTAQVAAFSRAHSMATQRMTVDTSALTRSIYFAAQGVEDLQYGFNAFVNNIPLISTSFAQAMGRSQTAAMAWGAALSVVGVTINSILIPAIQRVIDRDPYLKAFFDSMKNSLNPFHVEKYGDAITKLGDRIKELEGKKIRLAVDTFELDETKKKLDEAKKAKEAFDDAMTGRSKAEREAGKAVQEALAEAPAGEPAIAGQIRAFYAKQGQEQSPLLKDKQAEIDRAKAALAGWSDPLKTAGLPPPLISLGIYRAQNEIKRLQQEYTDIQSNIIKNADLQAGEIIGKAKEGRAPDVAKLLPFLQGFKQAPDLGIGPVAGDLSKQVEAAADAAREQVAIDRDIPALKKVADENEKVRKAGEALREGARQKAAQDKDKADAEAERIAHGAQQKAVQDTDKAEKERQRKAEQRTREVAGAFDQSVETSLAAMMQQNRAQREVVARMRPAERRQFLRQRQLEQREIKRQRAAEARGENLARRMMAPAERAAFDRQRQLRDRQRALFEAPPAPLGEDAMQALVRRRLAGQLVGAHDARGMVIDQATAGAAADAILNKLFEKINAAQLGAVAGVPPAGGRAGAIDQMFGGGMIDVMPPRMAPMGRGGRGFRSIAPAPPQAGGDFGVLGGQLATNQAGLVQSQARVANTAQQAFAYAQAVGRQVEDMMRWQARMQPQRGHFWPGFYGGF